jgi:hypothetical protein
VGKTYNGRLGVEPERARERNCLATTVRTSTSSAGSHVGILANRTSGRVGLGVGSCLKTQFLFFSAEVRRAYWRDYANVVCELVLVKRDRPSM